jgi:hypothetical protein
MERDRIFRDAEDAPVLAGLATASVQGTVALGRYRGARRADATGSRRRLIRWSKVNC